MDAMNLTKKLSQVHKENTAPNQVEKIQKANTRSILNISDPKRSSGRTAVPSNDASNSTAISNGRSKRLSMSEVSEMLYEFYRTKASKSHASQEQQQVITEPKAVAAAFKCIRQISSASAKTNEPSSKAEIDTNVAASDTASKNSNSDEMVTSKMAASFHPRIIYPDNIDKVPSSGNANECNMPTTLTAIPTSVVVPATNFTASESLDVKPIINAATGLVITANPSVIKPVPVSVSVPMSVPVPVTITPPNPQAAAIAAALIRDGYHSFQQQIRAQELIKFHTGKIKKNLKFEDSSASTSTSTKIFENFLRQQRSSECDTDAMSGNTDCAGDDEEDSRCNGFEDIHLVESTKTQFNPQMAQNVMASNTASDAQAPGDYYSDESQKYLNLAAQAQALRNLEYSFGELGSPNDNSNSGPTAIGPDGEPAFECRHCGKTYRWKSTLRRHENVECGGKEPSHQCPYCPYKSKQRGNLGVHVRKHHSNLPQLASKRRSKYSIKYEPNSASANVSDDSNSKLIIDCSK